MIARRDPLPAALLALLVVFSGCSRKPTSEQIQSWRAELQGLQAEQDSLRARAAELVAADPHLRNLPQGDVVLAIPTAFIRSVIVRVFDDVADNVTLGLTNLNARVTKSVKKVVKIGEFVLDVDIHSIRGKLQPGQPDLRFGDDRVLMTLPVTVSEGIGEATLHFVWDGKNVSGAACGDLDVTEKLTGSVIPSDYVVSGSMGLAMRGNEIVCTPVFPETKVRIRVKPSQASWDAVNAILAEKHGVCGWVLDKVNVPALLENIVQEKGFNVGLPVHKIPAFVVPAGVQQSVTVGGKTLTCDTKTNTLRVDPDAIWYSADIELTSSPHAPLID